MRVPFLRFYLSFFNKEKTYRWLCPFCLPFCEPHSRVSRQSHTPKFLSPNSLHHGPFLQLISRLQTLSVPPTPGYKENSEGGSSGHLHHLLLSLPFSPAPFALLPQSLSCGSKSPSAQGQQLTGCYSHHI